MSKEINRETDNFGIRLKKTRLKKGLTGKQFAEIIGIFRTKEDAFKMLCNKLLKKNPDLSGYEVLFLAFTFKELFYKSDKDSINYALTNFIVRDKIHELNTRIDTLKLSMIKEIHPNQKTNDNTHNKKNNNDKDIDEEGLNKGKGGPKR